MKRPLFTPEELEELRRFDAEIDAAEITDEDYRISDLIDSLLEEPERKRTNERKRAAYNQKKQEIVDEGGEEALKAFFKSEYAKTDKEVERERKRKWYQENKDRIRAQQKAYRIRSGRQPSAEEKARKKKEKAEKNAK